MTTLRWQILGVGILVPLLGAALLCALASLWPVRLDIRALQDLAVVQRVGVPASASNVLFFSKDNSIESARTATFALRHLIFPGGNLYWAALQEHCRGPWSGGFAAVDVAGNVRAATADAEGKLRWNEAPEMADEARKRAVDGILIYDSASTRDSFEQRWPFLKTSTDVKVLADAPAFSRIALRAPTSEFSVLRLARLAALLGSCIGICLAVMRASGPQWPNPWMMVTGALFFSVGLLLAMEYLLQWIAPPLVQWGPVAVWVLALLSAMALDQRKAQGNGMGDWFPLWSWSGMARSLLLYGLVAYALLFLVRLDFDGDVFNNWLPQGRFHYLLARHDPAAIITQGSMQAASYPPGYGIALSIVMWASAMDPSASFLIGDESSFAILVYRLFIFSLNAAFLTLVVLHVRLLGGSLVLGVLAVSATLLLLPTTAGKHIAAETLLFPMFAASIVLIATGRGRSWPALTTLGLAVGALATLVKWEATLIFALGVLPWLVSPRPECLSPVSARAKLGWAATVGLGMIAVIVWKATLPVRNDFFAPVTWAHFLASIDLFPSLATRAVRLMMDSGQLLLIAVALPVAAAVRFSDSRRWATLVIPAGIACLFGGFIAIFLFANLDPAIYLQTTYSRLTMIPTFGAILYCVDVLQDSCPSVAGAS